MEATQAPSAYSSSVYSPHLAPSTSNYGTSGALSGVPSAHTTTPMCTQATATSRSMDTTMNCYQLSESLFDNNIVQWLEGNNPMVNDMNFTLSEETENGGILGTDGFVEEETSTLQGWQGPYSCPAC